MVTQVQQLTESWTDIKSSLSLAVGTDYVVQGTGVSAVYIQEDTSEPNASERGHIVNTKDSWVVTPNSSDNIYVRSVSGNSEITVTETA